MFKLHRHKSLKPGEKVDFRLSSFQALQVPKGWDKILVSLVSLETGRTTAKTSKAVVRNGTCQWTETLTESIWISQDDASKELEECLFKLIVSMGSSRSSILGEVVINLTNYLSSRASVLVSFPLKKCNHGTILQVKIQCLAPRRDRAEQWKETNPQPEDLNTDYNDMDSRSDGSDIIFTTSVGSTSSNHLGNTSHQGDLGSRDPSFSASESRHSSDSADGSIDRVSFSPGNNLNDGVYNLIGRQDSTGSPNSIPYGTYPSGDLSRSNHSSFNSRASGSSNHHQNQHPVTAMSSMKNVGSSKELLDVAEETIEELRAEARMWERNARKLMFDLEIVKKECSDQSQRQADLNMELSGAYSERDGLKQEIEQLKTLLEESTEKKTATESSSFQAEGITHIQKELEDEIKFQQESNANLTLQMQKTQESNIELVSILQELEETIEKQRLEIDNLSALQSCNCRNDDSGELNLTKGSSLEKTRKASSNLDGAVDDTSNLVSQLMELQESQKSLQTTVQMLEKALEEKNQMIEVERSPRNQTVLDVEAEWRHKLSMKEEYIINLEAKLSGSPSSEDIRLDGGGDPDLTKEIQALKAKVQELERDCNELTDENLELILKLEKSKKDLQSGASFNEVDVFTSTSEPKVSNPGSQILQLEDELNRKEMFSEGVATSHLQGQLIDLQEKCTELEFQLQLSKDKACNLDSQLHKRQAEMQERELEITALQRQLKGYQERKTDKEDQLFVSCVRSENSDPNFPIEISRIFTELDNQLRLALAHARKSCCSVCSHENTNCEDDLDSLAILSSTDTICLKEQAEAILSNFILLNKLLEAKIKCEDALQNKVDIKERDVDDSEAQKKFDQCSLNENARLSIEECESLEMKLEDGVADLRKELVARQSEVEELAASLSLKIEEVDDLRLSHRKIESQVSTLQKEKNHLEENMEIVLREKSIASKCLDDVRHDLMVLSNSVASYASANKTLQRKCSDLESEKHELEVHLCDLEEENIKLSERVSAFEAQLRYLTDEKESSRLELDNSKSLASNLQDEIGRLVTEIEAQKVDFKQKLQDMQKRWSESQEECEYLKRANPKLQITAESLIEECSSLQKLNGELRNQKLELHERCMHLESRLLESRIKFSDCSSKVELLERKLSLVYEDTTLKEKLLSSELDALLHENKEHKEKLVLEMNLINQKYLDKTAEVEKLQREVAHLIDQISATHDERERLASDAILEVPCLRADKAKLEDSLQEVQAKVESSENELATLRVENAAKIQALVDELTVSRQSHELLISDHGKLMRLLEDVKSSEEKFRSTSNGLERKLTSCEYERQQLLEEIASLKTQLQKISQLQDEVLSLKNSLNETKFEKEKLESSLQLLSGDFEELKAERVSLIEKVSSMQEAVSELEDCRHSKVALEEKVLRLKGDLTAIEALCAQDAELKNELSRIKRTSSQFQRKIQHLVEEKDEYLKRVQVLEEELKQKREEKQLQSESSNKDLSEYSESNTNVFTIHEELNPEEKTENINRHGENQKLPSKKADQFSEDRPNLIADQYLGEGNNFHHNDHRSPKGIEVDPLSRIQVLENELSEALEANDMYKEQLRSLLSEEKNSHVDHPNTTEGEGVVRKEGNQRKASSLEAELREMRERYFQMSLKFADVEAQREELVMKLKAQKSGKRWFT
ncbi:PREDICTED: protein MLP1-like [Nelumbo nucifera]|uniref:Protein MLP1-like n=2 Tax=Nelumbo nucifera TaxID=4432 RepID=A0A1U7YUX6_NELNU|nr:PREDICTED: protein MLP1-like [Nelumbo nucifera]DAD28620.1 TPA_asm: hypothetical protein HUJ06_030088 [Nelumbo nucifera]